MALGGGAVLVAAHIGVLPALEECDIKTDMVVETSIGALVSTLFVFGLPWKAIQNSTMKMK
ncbi:patatin-like phospholipase family protein [Marinicella rhabdoformis]|uniref:patatin-like phospholipase family protein n=1 Tax=Marinicella rhabdoformis TaxID=2580566 RepID=UPI0012AEB299|nr:patatin-like phospholipase family protein [Marinicella rhabdoformis]